MEIPVPLQATCSVFNSCSVTIKRSFFLCLNVIHFSVPIASCPSVSTVEQSRLVARSTYRKMPQRGTEIAITVILGKKHLLLQQKGYAHKESAWIEDLGKRNSIAYTQNYSTYTRSNLQHEVFLHSRYCLWENYTRKMDAVKMQGTRE